MPNHSSQNGIVSSLSQGGISRSDAYRMTVFLTIIGVLLIVAGVQDLFHTLFHPAKSGNVCDWIARQIWRVFRRALPGVLSFAGPVAFVIIVLYWAASITIGFALIYLPRLPQDFTFASGLNPAAYGSFFGALSVSLGSLITLSTGAYASRLPIQLLMGMESVFGFGLLTASVSWILSIYPVFEHRKSLAHEASLLHFAELKGIKRLQNISDSDLQQILFGLASQLITSRNELSQFPITYYFHEEETKTALAGILPYMADIAEQNVNRNGAAGIAATTLGGAVDDYLKLIAQAFLRCKFTKRDDILRAFADEHMRKVVRSPERLPKAA
jgi:hypothetical protein